MAINKLGNAAWKHLKEGTHDDGGGLKLVVRPPRQDQASAKVTKSWVYKYTFLGKMGSCNIGSASKMSIAAALAHRDTLNDALAMNQDPKTTWRRIKRPHLNGPDCRFKAVAEDCWKPKYTNLDHKNAKAWISAVRKVVYPRLGETLIYDITTADIVDVFADYVEKSPDMALTPLDEDERWDDIVVNVVEEAITQAELETWLKAKTIRVPE